MRLLKPKAKALNFTLFFVSVIFVIFFFKSQGLKTKQHAEFISNLKTCRHLDAQVNEEVIKLRHNLSVSFDALTISSQEIGIALEGLADFEMGKLHEGNQEFLSLSEDVLNLYNEKKDLIEDFKSENSVFSNSIRNFPIGAERFLSGDGSQAIKNHVKDLLRSIMVYERTSSPESRGKSESIVSTIKKYDMKNETSEVSSLVKSLVTHATIILDRKQLVDTVFRQLIDAPVGITLDRLNKKTTEIYLSKEKETRIYTIFLNILSVLILSGIFVVIYNLKKASRFLERVNLELEARVEARTRDFHDSELHNRTIVEASYDAIVTIDSNGYVYSVNPACTEMFSYVEEELIGQNVDVLIPDPDEKLHHDSLEKYLKKGEIKTLGKGVELFALNKNGEKFPIHIVINEMVIGDEKMFLAVIRDITDQKNKEAELLGEKENAEAASIAKSEFLANMSHEIRTPMNGVIGMTSLLMDTSLVEEQKDYVETIKNSSEALMTIINDILDFSKIEAGKLDIEEISFDLRIAVEEVTRLLKVRAQEKNIELIVDYVAGTSCYVVGDPGRIRQILTNLIGNAIKFTSEGSVTLKVIQKDQGEFSFGVKDTGVGIPEDRVDLLFDKFSQADSSTTRKYGGTGLGLAISKQLVGLMGGSIEAKNNPEGGALFHFVLPLKISEQVIPNIKHTKADITGLKILIVDDNEESAHVLSQQLSSWGMEVDFCLSSQRAIEKLHEAQGEAKPYQMAIVDQYMPSTDGLELAKLIKADSMIEKTILVMYTAFSVRGDAINCSQSGFSAFLTKPASPSELKETIAYTWGMEQKSHPPSLVTRYTLVEGQQAGNDEDEERQDDKHIRALLVEDNIVNQKVAKKILEKFNCRVDIAANGLEALDLVEKLPYDIIFMDMQMPEMDGLEATRKIRELEDQKKALIRIVAMTANAMQGDRERCLEAGMNDYMAKPIVSEKVGDMLKKWV